MIMLIHTGLHKIMPTAAIRTTVVLSMNVVVVVEADRIIRSSSSIEIETTEELGIPVITSNVHAHCASNYHHHNGYAFPRGIMRIMRVSMLLLLLLLRTSTTHRILILIGTRLLLILILGIRIPLQKTT